MPLESLGVELLQELSALEANLRRSLENPVVSLTTRWESATRRALKLVEDLHLGESPPEMHELRQLREVLEAALKELHELSGAVAAQRLPPGTFNRLRAIGIDLRHYDELGLSRVDLAASFQLGPPSWFTVRVEGFPLLVGGGHTLDRAIADLAKAVVARPPRFLSPVVLGDEARLLSWLRALTPLPTLDDDTRRDP